MLNTVFTHLADSKRVKYSTKYWQLLYNTNSYSNENMTLKSLQTV